MVVVDVVMGVVAGAVRGTARSAVRVVRVEICVEEMHRRSGATPRCTKTNYFTTKVPRPTVGPRPS